MLHGEWQIAGWSGHLSEESQNESNIIRRRSRQQCGYLLCPRQSKFNKNKFLFIFQKISFYLFRLIPNWRTIAPLLNTFQACLRSTRNYMDLTLRSQRRSAWNSPRSMNCKLTSIILLNTIETHIPSGKKYSRTGPLKQMIILIPPAMKFLLLSLLN